MTSIIETVKMMMRQRTVVVKDARRTLPRPRVAVRATVERSVFSDAASRKVTTARAWSSVATGWVSDRLAIRSASSAFACVPAAGSIGAPAPEQTSAVGCVHLQPCIAARMLEISWAMLCTGGGETAAGLLCASDGVCSMHFDTQVRLCSIVRPQSCTCTPLSSRGRGLMLAMWLEVGRMLSSSSIRMHAGLLANDSTSRSLKRPAAGGQSYNVWL